MKVLSGPARALLPAIALIVASAVAGCVDSAPADPRAPVCAEGASMQPVNAHGSVVDEGVRALSGARVLIGSHETATSSSGAWAIDGLKDGCIYQVVVSHPDCEGWKGAMKPTAQARNFALDCS